jgi:hypothetical protein
MKPSLGAVFVPRGIVDESEETLALSTPGVPAGDCAGTGPVVAIERSLSCSDDFEDHHVCRNENGFTGSVSGLENQLERETIGQEKKSGAKA